MASRVRGAFAPIGGDVHGRGSPLLPTAAAMDRINSATKLSVAPDENTPIKVASTNESDGKKNQTNVRSRSASILRLLAHVHPVQFDWRETMPI